MRRRKERDHALLAYRGEFELGSELGAEGKANVDAAAGERSGHRAFHISWARTSTSGWSALNARPSTGSVSKRVLHE